MDESSPIGDKLPILSTIASEHDSITQEPSFPKDLDDSIVDNSTMTLKLENRQTQPRSPKA